jgi:hypothetical protein
MRALARLDMPVSLSVTPASTRLCAGDPIPQGLTAKT